MTLHTSSVFEAVERSTTKRESITSAPPSVVMREIGGRLYPATYASQCKVCRSEYRYDIEQAINTGMSYTRIALEVVPQGLPAPEQMSSNSIMRHHKSHMDVQAKWGQAMKVARAKERGVDTEVEIDVMADHIFLAKEFVRRGITKLNSMSDDELEMKDVLSAVKFLADAEKAAADQGNDSFLRAAFHIYVQVTIEQAGRETFNRIAAALANDPRMQSIIEEVRRRELVAG